MKIEQRTLNAAGEWCRLAGQPLVEPAHLLLVFGDRDRLDRGEGLARLMAEFPGAQTIVASTSGEISNNDVVEGGMVATAVSFARTRVASASVSVEDVADSYNAGRELASRLAGPDLVNVFVVSDGQKVNGTNLAKGFNDHLPPGVRLSGGLAGDGTRFERTLVGLNGPPVSGGIAAVGFYGRALQVGIGSAGGWAPFGPVRNVTRSKQNTLFELDGQSALELYKKYLGDQAAHLPGSALRFPLCVTPPGADHTVVRTILSIDEAAQSMTFAGDIPSGAQVRFMRASYEDLIDGAALAATRTGGDAATELALCVSCVGRRIVLRQRTEEETESVRAVVGPTAVLAGFYSYGELAPVGSAVACQLHNQTMTITTMRET